MYGQMRNVHKIFVGKPEGKRPLVRPKHRLENNIKVDRKGMGCGGVYWIWIHLALVETLMLFQAL
jgi:hypothetical protein